MAKRRRPESLTKFQERFPDDRACANHLFAHRWPNGFRCPSCGSPRATILSTRAFTHQCRVCRRQTSVTAGTVMHRAKLPLRYWFWAAHLMATHSNGMSALQLAAQLNVTYKTAWLLCQKLRRSMVDPDRTPLEGVVEVDQAEIPFRTSDSFFDGARADKIVIIGAVENISRRSLKILKKPIGAKYIDTRSGRIRLAVIPSNGARHIEAFVRANVKPGSTLITDGHKSYLGLATDYRHDPRAVREVAGHVLLPWIHRVFSLVKRWGLGTYHGLRRQHIDTYLNEFVFRYNQRFYRHVSFGMILGLAARSSPKSYWDIVGKANPRIVDTKGKPKRRSVRRRNTDYGMLKDGHRPLDVIAEVENLAKERRLARHLARSA